MRTSAADARILGLRAAPLRLVSTSQANNTSVSCEIKFSPTDETDLRHMRAFTTRHRFLIKRH